MNQHLHDAWWRLVSRPPRSASARLGAGVLRAASMVYGAGVAGRNAAYDRGWAAPVRLSRPVVSVGNLSVGGTGKTVCVEHVARLLARSGRRVAILSRGYQGRAASAPYVLCVQESHLLINREPAQATDHLPDEAQLLAWRLPGTPVVVGPRRAESGRLAIDQWQADALIMDDGFQHRRLDRALDIVLVPAAMPLDGWPLLPRGPLREPVASLRRAGIIILTKADQAMERVAALGERLHAINPSAVVAMAAHEPGPPYDAQEMSRMVSLDRLQGLNVALVSGLGDPGGFEQTVKRLGAVVISHAAYPDHHWYTLAQWNRLAQAARTAGAAAVITTEKDWMRLRPVLGAERPLPLWVLPVRFRLLTGERELHARLAAVLAR